MAAPSQDPHAQLHSALASLAGSSPYAVLGVPESATPATIKSRFRELALALHPDRHMGADDPAAVRAKFDRVKTAHDVLTSRTLRALYDRHAVAARSSFRPPPPRTYAGAAARPAEPVWFTRFDPDASYDRFSYYAYRPAPSKPASGWSNRIVSIGVLAFAVAGATMQYYRYTTGSSLVRAALDAENAENLKVLENVRLRAAQRSAAQFHTELERHIAGNVARRAGRAVPVAKLEGGVSSPAREVGDGEGSGEKKGPSHLVY
ncbi:hypothetical protein AMAG_08847 [Allomyces macrogynus ATCC 38327]|uniref:J domain-containing protein n=1 Tax=Allomyces macrogynus (strain ATCC 38327) TaxID=578462 RepID=A0A0L0SMQ5_ALLM3|nr:hypothetical protein AMAG_08847 [Allomyces macrogynus ATCC 38327]|eukprot:KNE63767.1 hypothetical protein AMAG_08847 [Allomyces macrogynus ATCC 38327]